LGTFFTGAIAAGGEPLEGVANIVEQVGLVAEAIGG